MTASSCLPVLLRHSPICASPFNMYMGSCEAASKCSAACLNKPTFLSAVPRSYDSCPFSISAELGISMVELCMAGTIVRLSVSDRTWGDTRWTGCFAVEGLDSFTVVFPLSREPNSSKSASFRPCGSAHECVVFQCFLSACLQLKAGGRSLPGHHCSKVPSNLAKRWVEILKSDLTKILAIDSKPLHGLLKSFSKRMLGLKAK
jgi:hypothetical protein